MFGGHALGSFLQEISERRFETLLRHSQRIAFFNFAQHFGELSHVKKQLGNVKKMWGKLTAMWGKLTHNHCCNFATLTQLGIAIRNVNATYFATSSR